MATRKNAQGTKTGTTTDEKQDLFRAMVVFAAAGLDSTLKQLVRDALLGLAERGDQVVGELEKHLARRLSGSAEDDPATSVGRRCLARLLLSSSPREACVELVVRELTSSSLQSFAELCRAAAALGVPKTAFGCEDDVRAVLDARNQIIHEMDIDFNQQRRNRKTRGREDMVKYANILLTIAGNALGGVDTRLQEPP
jgi:hypothetical protein